MHKLELTDQELQALNAMMTYAINDLDTQDFTANELAITDNQTLQNIINLKRKINSLYQRN